jgi:uncharacterized protein with PIN domain
LEIDDSSDLIYQTYFMVNWAKTKQTPSQTRCVSCGGAMMDVEPARDKKGVVFDGIVCHKCKTLLWTRRKDPRPSSR